MFLLFQGRLEAVDVAKAVEFVLKCMNFDGAFGRVPGSESHAGQVSPTPEVLHCLDHTLVRFCMHIVTQRF